MVIHFHFVFKITRTTIVVSNGSIGVAAIGAMGTKAPPDKARNLSIRNQEVLKY